MAASSGFLTCLVLGAIRVSMQQGPARDGSWPDPAAKTGSLTIRVLMLNPRAPNMCIMYLYVHTHTCAYNSYFGA